MKQMVLMVLNNPDYCMTLMEAWESAGAPGITILESTGLATIRQGGGRDDLPLLPSLADIFRSNEEHHRTIFSVVDDEAQAQALIQVTEKVFEEYEASDRDESGILFVLPVAESQSFATSRARKRYEKER